MATFQDNNRLYQGQNEEYDDYDEYDEYDDFSLDARRSSAAVCQRRRQQPRRAEVSVYSSKHVRAKTNLPKNVKKRSYK